MKLAIAALSSLSPYSQSRNYEKEFPRRQRATGVAHETHEEWRDRTWREHSHTTDEGEVFIPPMSIKNALSECAKYLGITIPGKGKNTYTKHFEAGVMIAEPILLGIKKKDLESEHLFLPANGRRGDGSRIWKTYPLIRSWTGTVKIHILDETVTKSVLLQHLKEAGNFIGIGRFRPRKNGYYGRFTVDKMEWTTV